MYTLNTTYTSRIDYTEKADREGGRPLELSIEKLDVNGFIGDQGWGKNKFMPPCIFYAYTNPNQHKESASSSEANVRH